MKNIVSTAQPLVTLAKFFCYFPFAFNKKYKLRLSKFSILHASINVLIVFYIIKLRISHLSEYQLEGSFVSKITYLVSAALTMSFTILCLVVNILNKKVVEKFFEEFWKFDKIVSKFKMKLKSD